MITVYGIPNCSSVKKTRVWLMRQALVTLFMISKNLGLMKQPLSTGSLPYLWVH